MAKDDSGSDQSDDDVSQEILERLNSYGNSLLDDSTDNSKRKKSKKQKLPTVTKTPTVMHSTSIPNKSKKRRKNKGKSQNEEDHSDTPVKMSHIDKLKSMLSLTEEEIIKRKEKRLEELHASNRDSTLDPVVTDANRLKRKRRPPPEVIVFQDPARRAKKKKPKVVVAEEEEVEEEGEEFDLRRSRWEVQKFGITALDTKEKAEAQEELAIKLGARPPKKPCVNYKEFMEKRKQEKKAEEERADMMAKLGLKVSKPVETKRPKKDINNVGMLDGQIGRFKFGVQKVSQGDIDKMSKPKGGKFGKRPRKR